jgi:fructuronate reductase
VTERLSEAALARLPAELERPLYDRRSLRAGVIHIGLGAFHRAHQGFVFHRLAQAGHRDWGVIGVAVNSPDVCDALAPQDRLYSVLEREGDARRLAVCGALTDVLVAAETPARVEDRIADPAIALVTLTITEKGYDAGESRVWPILARALAKRRGLDAPLTVLSCDNLTGNGAVARRAVLRAIDDDGLRTWVEARCAFPSSMVDRITPASTAADLDEVEHRLGVRDEAAVVTEPFWQWVVEGRFAGRAPPLAEAGVQVVADVAPWERAKLRLLNAAHSTLAYAGLLAGLEFVHQAIAFAPLVRLIEQQWDEAAATLGAPPELDMAAYRASLLRRFRNPSLHHRLAQIAEDGSRKLPQRLLQTLAARQAKGLPSPATLLALACWVACLEGHDPAGRPIPLVDPKLAALRAARRSGADGLELMAAVGMIDRIEPAAQAAILAELARLRRNGVRAALAELA